MKKILLVALAAAGMVSCSQNEEIENAGQKAEIRFSTVVKNGTRAVINDNNNFSEFTVCGYKTADVMADGVQLASGFMDNVNVTKSDNTWSTATTFYWPATGKVQFFATYPAQTLDITSAGYPKFDYKVGAIDAQVDLVAAKVLDKDKTAAGITLPFQHLLTQVNFSIKGDLAGCTYKLTKLELSNLNDNGSFQFTSATDGVGGTWTLGSATANLKYTYEKTSGVEVIPTADLSDAVALEEDGKALFMLLPQDASGIKANITYTATPGDGSEGFSGTKEVTLTKTWNPSMKVRYTLLLTSDRKPITFEEPTFGTWTEASDAIDSGK